MRDSVVIMALESMRYLWETLKSASENEFTTTDKCDFHIPNLASQS
jgi:hypothetical protein